MRTDLKKVSSTFLNNYKPPPKRTLPRIVMDTCQEAARILVRSRSAVIRDWRNKDVEFPAEVLEIPSRVYEQFLLLSLGLRSFGTPTDLTLKLIKRVLLDSIPYVRMRCLEAVSEGSVLNVDIAKTIKLSTTYASRCMEDMEYLGVVKRDVNGSYRIISTVLDNALKNGVRKP
jgi:hypothetical protein